MWLRTQFFNVAEGGELRDGLGLRFSKSVRAEIFEIG